jgi:cobaltochelatase CobN
MGGMNLAVRKVTGKDPEAYLSDYRNRNHVKMQEVKEAIGVESRTTVLNPTYVKEKMKGGSGDASAFADVVRNTYGWNVMKPNAIDNELWNDLYDMYVKDVHGLGTKEFFTSKNPAALEEITAVMMETARKGMWKASKEQLSTLAELHTEIVKEQGASCSGFVCNNSKLRDFIASNVSAAKAQQYNQSIAQIRSEQVSSKDGMVMQKEELNAEQETTKSVVSGVIVAVIVIAAIVGLLVLLKRRRKNME